MPDGHLSVVFSDDNTKGTTRAQFIIDGENVGALVMRRRQAEVLRLALSLPHSDRLEGGSDDR